MTVIRRDISGYSAAVTSAPDHPSTSSFDEVNSRAIGTCAESTVGGNYPGPATTTSAPVVCIGGGHSLAQSFVLYFAPTVVVLALVMCMARLLFTYCAFRRQEDATVPPPGTATANSASRRHRHQHLHTVDVDQVFPMSFDQRGSFAHIFMQQPPPSYEQTQKYRVPPHESNFDPAPPAYTYANPSCVDEQQPQHQSATGEQQAVEVSSLPAYSHNEESSDATTASEGSNRPNTIQHTAPSIE